jgi:large subunit ribosomal protein L4
MKTAIFNQEGKKTDTEVLLPKEIFEVPLNPDLVYQVAVSQLSNRRQKIAKTKDRSEVRGGGRKPWRQKGTGRARHGSRRSPIWVGGGVTFGPNLEKNFKRTIPKKMKRKALFMVLSEKAKNNFIIILDSLKKEKPETKSTAKVFDKLFLKDGSGLVALSENNTNTIKSVRNISGINVVQAKDLNVLDLLNYKYLVMPKDSIKVIKDTFVKNK